jgi:TonB family protein
MHIHTPRPEQASGCLLFKTHNGSGEKRQRMKTTKGWCVLLLSVLFVQCASTTKRIRPPHLQSDLKLDYPIAAQMNRMEGQADVAVFVSSTGHVEEVKLLKSSGYQVLDDAAIAFSQNAAFEPALVDNKPVSAWTRLILRYRLTEVPFDRGRWLSEVHSDLKQALDEPDSVKREPILRRLYTNYAGLYNYGSNRTDVMVNDIADLVVDRRIKERWQPLWSYYALPFVVLEDFLLLFPNSALAARAKEDLIRMLLDVEFRIRMDSLHSQSKARRGLPFIDRIESRLQELGFVAMPAANPVTK